MTNDPDLLDKTCPDCKGNGGWLQDLPDESGSRYHVCVLCGGEGMVVEP